MLKSNGKQRITMAKKGNYVKFWNREGKIKLPFIIYADFETILFSEIEKQNPNKSYTNRYQKYLLVLMVKN